LSVGTGGRIGCSLVVLGVGAKWLFGAGFDSFFWVWSVFSVCCGVVWCVSRLCMLASCFWLGVHYFGCDDLSSWRLFRLGALSFTFHCFS